MTENYVDFIGGYKGVWKVLSMEAISGHSLENVPYIDILQSSVPKENNGVQTLTGFTSNVRYAEKAERDKLNAIQADLGRQKATCAALIPIRKNEIWWAMAQDERRKIFETKSHHTEKRLKYLPAITHKLYHCRDI